MKEEGDQARRPGGRVAPVAFCIWGPEMGIGRVFMVGCLLLGLAACDEDSKDPLKRPAYQRGYADGVDDGKAAVCKRIYNYSKDIHQDLSNEGICR